LRSGAVRPVLVAAAICVGGLMLGAAIEWPLVAVLAHATLDGLFPERIDWDAKTAWAKCESAVGGSIPWPQAPARACAAMHMCANEAPLDASQQQRLRALAGSLPGCGEP
jgi:hypothetical protein